MSCNHFVAIDQGDVRDVLPDALARIADISYWDEAEALVQFCVSSFGALDGFGNNAALFHMALAQEETEARVRRLTGVECAHRTVRTVASEFSCLLQTQQLPPGVVSYDVTVRNYDVPYWRADSADQGKTLSRTQAAKAKGDKQR